MADSRTVQVNIFGKVQGVCFREYTRRKACELNLAGWVRNRRDGSVEALISGMAEAVDEMITWLHTGSPYASVREVAVQDIDEQPLENIFTITY